MQKTCEAQVALGRRLGAAVGAYYNGPIEDCSAVALAAVVAGDDEHMSSLHHAIQVAHLHRTVECTKVTKGKLRVCVN